ncbi:MAG: addiction module antidote protein, HigA family [Candidatus Melainabacteria bacterium RIFOXYA12_FULL_32_12]|nr:MAG: addiction module antidote protein, HigA family [Candidatus Melainabacteria bacterium RIFOXYA2_FULL_32_9]OGI29950.1 MAG: addiction module antidote protein, HigA family [Candidatus Melainabacteria bacterium RIFOXYA12_FULL_32_12]
MIEVKPFTHPGIILQEEFTKPLGITQAKLSEDLHVGIKTISEIYNEKRGISPLMALKLANYFGTTPEFWMNLQSNYDLYKTYLKEKKAIEQVKSRQVA